MELPILVTRHRSSLFTIRLWQENVGSGTEEVRMQVRHVLSGETHCFREWARLIEYLEYKLQEPDQA